MPDFYYAFALLSFFSFANDFVKFVNLNVIVYVVHTLQFHRYMFPAVELYVAFIHKEMQGRNEVAEVRVYANVIIKGRF